MVQKISNVNTGNKVKSNLNDKFFLGELMVATETNNKKIKITSNYLNLILSYIISIVLLFYGISKVIDSTNLIENLSITFDFLSDDFIIVIVSLLPIVEIGLGVLLLLTMYVKDFRRHNRKILLVITILMGIFLMYSIYGNIIGIEDDCGCFGDTIRSDFGTGMIIRNAILFIIPLIITKTSLLEQKTNN